MSALILDTETTDKDNAELIEAAWIRMPVDNDLVGAAPDRISTRQPTLDAYYCERFKPSKPISFGAMAVHHILPQELEGCRPSAEFLLPLDARYLIGHSIDYDWKVIGSPTINRICTHAIATHLWPQADSFSLVALIYMLEKPSEVTRQVVKGAHGAATDCCLVQVLLQHILALKLEITTWSALHEYSESCRIPLSCPLNKWKGATFLEVALKDPGYCYWYLRLPDADPYLALAFERGLQQAAA